MSKRILGALYLALAASIWGGMYVVSKVVLMMVSPLVLVWLRYVVALLTLMIVTLATRQSWHIRRRDIPIVVAIGVIGYVVSVWTQFLGTQLSSAQMGAVITASTPAFMVIFARLLLGEKVTRTKTLSVIIATIGVLMIVGVGEAGKNYQLGEVVLGIAALSWALMSVLIKRLPGDYPQLVITTYAILHSDPRCVSPASCCFHVSIQSPCDLERNSVFGNRVNRRRLFSLEPRAADGRIPFVTDSFDPRRSSFGHSRRFARANA